MTQLFLVIINNHAFIRMCLRIQWTSSSVATKALSSHCTESDGKAKWCNFISSNKYIGTAERAEIENVGTFMMTTPEKKQTIKDIHCTHSIHIY